MTDVGNIPVRDFYFNTVPVSSIWLGNTRIYARYDYIQLGTLLRMFKAPYEYNAETKTLRIL